MSRQSKRQTHGSVTGRAIGSFAASAALLTLPGPTPAQALPPSTDPQEGWRACVQLQGDDAAQLQCFRAWARVAQGAGPVGTADNAPPAGDPSNRDWTRVESGGQATKKGAPERSSGCGDARHTELSRFWELERDSACDTFGIRGYRPITLAWTIGDPVNTLPTSPAAGRTAAAPTAWRPAEMRIQLSVRTKIAQGLLTQGEPTRRDSLWFGYTSQSHWQLFNAPLSRPFRNTDHEPELIYVYPLDLTWPGGWRQRVAGLGLVHQSNGQSLPLSRSWNRVYAMAAFERSGGWQLQARLWRRLSEKPAQDDNPDISDRIGRAELSTLWQATPQHQIGVTLRHPLSSAPGGSVRLEWFWHLGAPTSGLRLHTALFHGYGDSLLDYNRRRTTLSLGLSLVEF